MTSTPVKDVNSAFMNMTAAQNGKNQTGNGDFLKVWSNQMGKGAQGSAAWGNLSQGSLNQLSTASVATTTAKQSTEVSKADSNSDTQTESSKATQSGQETQNSTVDNDNKVSDTAVSKPEQPDELTSEELEEAMEVLGMAAMELMQQIADVFGISMEELQAAMEDLGMDITDVLDVSELGALLLNLGGADNSYALVTDETLYGRYQELMGELGDVLQESADALGMSPDELALLLEKASGKEEIVPGKVEDLKQKPETEIINPETDAKAVVEEPLDTVQNVQEQPNGQANEQDGQENAQGSSQNQTGQVHREVRQESDKGDREQPVSLFSQHLDTEFEPEVQQAQVPQSTGWSTDTQNIMNQIMDYMKLQLNADTTSLEMQLHPASLGALQIQLASKAGVVTANFIAQNEAVKAALESQISQLKESFEEQGVKVEAIEVTVQTHEFERNLEQGRERNQQEPEKKNRTRRINLNNPMDMESMDEEEALAADMLAASGSTVEFTA